MGNYPLFINLKQAVGVLGISLKELRLGCKNGTIPHIRVGEGKNARFMINLPKYLEQLNQESMENMLTQIEDCKEASNDRL